MRSILAQLVIWMGGPAVVTLIIVGLTTAVATYQPTVIGHALQAPSPECTTSPDEFFNDCAVLDTTQVIDTRDQYGEITCPAGVRPGTPEGWRRCDITTHPADGPADDTELEIP